MNRTIIVLMAGLIFTFIGDISAIIGIGLLYQRYLLSWSLISQNAMVVLIVIYCMRHQDEDWHPISIACIALVSLIILPVEVAIQI